LTLELHDQSRPLAGDRWLVSLQARIEVPLRQEFFASHQNGEHAYEEMASLYGSHLVFVQEKVRHFVDARDVEKVLAGLVQRVKGNMLAYLGNAKFPSRYLLKEYADLQKRKSWSTDKSENQ